MEFRLVYQGYLPGSGNSSRHPKEKHAIRRTFHKQLKRLWTEHKTLEHKWQRVPILPPMARPIMDVFRKAGYINNVPGISEVEMLARDFTRCGHRFVPLVNERFDLACALNILFLRRGNPGGLFDVDSGDIDNRIKTLLDALKMPDRTSQVEPPSEDEDPFFCLLEDDSMITDLNVTTDRLLTPKIDEGRDSHEVLLVVHVTLKATKITLENLQLLA